MCIHASRTRANPRFRRARGFTLPEVVIAGAILALFVAGSVATMAQINRWANAARLRTLALALAQQKADEILTTPWQMRSTRPAALTAGTATEATLTLNNDPHNNADKSQQACLGCHQVAHRQQERCATCHMPRTRAVDANHGVMTDHSIPKTQKREPLPSTETLAPFLGKGDDRALGLAYAELGDKRAWEHLLRATPQDWPVRLRLAVLEPNAARAAQLYESVLSDNPSAPAALVNLGSYLAQRGRTAEAGRLWDRALAVNPALEEAVLNLTQIRSAVESRILLNRYLDLNPVSRKAKLRMAELGKTDK